MFTCLSRWSWRFMGIWGSTWDCKSKSSTAKNAIMSSYHHFHLERWRSRIQCLRSQSQRLTKSVMKQTVGAGLFEDSVSTNWNHLKSFLCLHGTRHIVPSFCDPWVDELLWNGLKTGFSCPPSLKSTYWTKSTNTNILVLISWMSMVAFKFISCCD